MHIKFLPHGKGSATGAVAYLLARKDHLGTEREQVEVLRGNPELVAQVADSLDFVHRYSSGVVSWSPEEQPTREEIDGVLNDLERVFCAGLDDPARVSWTGVLHQEKDGGVHVHLLVARVDLETGKSLNVAPPGWERTYDPLRDAWNYEKGWARPDDPARARLGRPDGHQALIEASALRAGLSVDPDPKALITRFLVAQVEAGLIEDRKDMIAALRGAGLEVPREGKDYLTVLDPETQKRYRLKGALYAEGFTRDAAREFGRAAQSEIRAGLGRGGSVDPEQARQARGELEQAIERITQYRVDRYRAKAPELEVVHEQDLAVSGPGIGGPDLGNADRSGDVRTLATGAVEADREETPEHRDQPTEVASALSGEGVAREVVSDSSPDQLHPADVHQRKRPKRRRHSAHELDQEEDHDRDRTALVGGLERLERASGSLNDAIGDHDQQLQSLIEQDGSLREAAERNRQGRSRLDREFAGLRQAAERFADLCRRTAERAREVAQEIARKVASIGHGMGL